MRLAHIPCFLNIIHFLLQHVPHRFDLTFDGCRAFAQTHGENQGDQVAKVRLHCAADTWVLDFYCDLFAGLESRSMHLSDGCSSKRFLVECCKKIGRVLAQFAL